MSSSVTVKSLAKSLEEVTVISEKVDEKLKKSREKSDKRKERKVRDFMKKID